MMEFAGGIFVGAFGMMFLLVQIHRTPLDEERKMCVEANWKLPTCVKLINKAVLDAMGN